MEVPRKQPRRIIFPIRWTAEERRLLEAAAKNEGVTLAEYVRHFALTAAGRVLGRPQTE